MELDYEWQDYEPLDDEQVIMKRKRSPSLIDLCVQKAIDNLRYIGDVGETALHLLERILPHCTLEQLMRIENSTEDRDLSSVTDMLWKKFYKLQFGDKDYTAIVERMKKKKVVFKWKLLYQTKLKEIEEHQQETIARMKELYKREGDRKQSRQVRLCTKVPPSSNKRNFYGSGPGSSIGYTKSNLMKKAKLDYLNSQEVKNAVALKRNMVQRTQQRYSAPIMRKPQSAPIIKKPESVPIINKPQSAPIIKKPQSASIIRKPQSAPIIRKPQSAPITRKPQSGHYSVNRSGASSSSSSTPRFAGDLLKQRRFF